MVHIVSCSETAQTEPAKSSELRPLWGEQTFGSIPEALPLDSHTVGTCWMCVIGNRFREAEKNPKRKRDPKKSQKACHDSHR